MEWKDLRALVAKARMVHEKMQVEYKRKHKNKPTPIDTQLNHLHSEVVEVWEELRKPNRDARKHREYLINETSDIVYSALTANYLMHFTDEQIVAGLIKCLRKIQDRAFKTRKSAV